MNRGPALLVSEFSSIARGLVCADAAVKRSPAVLLQSRTVSAGRHVLVFEGDVAEIEEVAIAVRATHDGTLLSLAELAHPSEQVWPLVDGLIAPRPWADDEQAESVGIVETDGVPPAIEAADAALKMADMTIQDARLSIDLGGKAFFTMTGRLPDVQASAEAARVAAGTRLIRVEVIAQPAPWLRARLFR